MRDVRFFRNRKNRAVKKNAARGLLSFLKRVVFAEENDNFRSFVFAKRNAMLLGSSFTLYKSDKGQQPHSAFFKND